MRFSIIVPVYNVEKYLAKCIESILNQTNQDFELLLVNDGTKDNSQKIIDEYVAKYPDKVYGFVKENGGLSDARNYGVERAKGEYIIFIDSDDYVDDELLEKVNDAIEKNAGVDVEQNAGCRTGYFILYRAEYIESKRSGRKLS